MYLFTWSEDLFSCFFFSIAPSTMGSILSLLIQRSMKQSYRKSPSISSRYHELFDQIMKDKKKNNVIQMYVHSTYYLGSALNQFVLFLLTKLSSFWKNHLKLGSWDLDACKRRFILPRTTLFLHWVPI